MSLCKIVIIVFIKKRILSGLIQQDENILWSRQKSISSLQFLIIYIIMYFSCVWLIISVISPNFVKISLILGSIPFLLLIIIFSREYIKKRHEDIIYFITDTRIGKIRNFREESLILNEIGVKDLTSVQIFNEKGLKTSITVYFFNKDNNTFYFEDMRDILSSLLKVLKKNFNVQIVEKWSKNNQERVLKEPNPKSQSIFIPEKTISITPKNIESISAQLGWKGTGSPEDPYIIQNSFKQLGLSLKKLSEGIIIRGLEDKEISLENCENLTIENSSLVKLSFYSCYKILVKNCNLTQVNITWSRENIFENNDLTQESSDRILSNLADKQNLQLVKWSCPILIILINVMYGVICMDGRLDLTDITTSIFFLFITFACGIIYVFVFIKTSKLKPMPPNRVIELKE